MRISRESASGTSGLKAMMWDVNACKKLVCSDLHQRFFLFLQMGFRVFRPCVANGCVSLVVFFPLFLFLGRPF